ncbi:fructose-1,6-bisphosphatase I/sedoheptulose-1,7-bisphosphatase [Kribbella orskensis]|uniref:Fructose-1,6-bisphosphatase class 1 n=1 Tax=Kribbella orskensis TaxID=2512216 RepID=A0ABY2BTD5_9ACTN|nr:MULTISPECIES: class 1 fructose-bisphosphatase [Kribbella]TCN44695.1 fructose-1,6-bisphosphatase I/sedoheptulose-1,7-bisphosphatase [Kribbella sp. VKM Ac-2500]TCO31527.1 fructose-1,6-bisphosphatase I/sedoheptulose-1,7-bisphosphatase [Kribbella orskensis]
MPTERSTLTQFLAEERRRHPGLCADLSSLIVDVALACKAISHRITTGALTGVLGGNDVVNVQGEQQQKLDVLANDIFLRTNEGGGKLAGMASEELDTPYAIPSRHPRGQYLLTFDPLDGSSNIDVNVSVGSIFSILRAPVPGAHAQPDDFLQPGTEQVAGGYAIYGPSTVLVLTVGTGVHAFTLDPSVGEFLLTRQDIKLPASTAEFAINTSNRRFWQPAVARYVDECLAGTSGPRQKDFNMRWVASLVAETHRILTRGGVFLYPRDSKDPAKEGRLRLLYEANPIAFLIEQAGGKASTGHERVLDVRPAQLHQRIGFIFGAREEVERIERYHAEHSGGDAEEQSHPLYGFRGLYRSAS